MFKAEIVGERGKDQFLRRVCPEGGAGIQHECLEEPRLKHRCVESMSEGFSVKKVKPPARLPSSKWTTMIFGSDLGK